MTLGSSRLRALCDLDTASAREVAGRHEYDGRVQDLSLAGVAGALDALGVGPPCADPHDEARLRIAEEAARVRFGELELHRRDPMVHVRNLDLTDYARSYAPIEQRLAAREEHVRAWPDAVSAAIQALDDVAAPVAAAAIPVAEGLANSLGPQDERARGALSRLLSHLHDAAGSGKQDFGMGATGLTRLLASAEGVDVDLGQLEERADSERGRLRELLTESCHRIDAKAPVADTMRVLALDRPEPHELVDEVRALVGEVIEWTAEHDLVPHHDGLCLVGPTPEAQPFAVAMMIANAPFEPDGPSWFRIAPPRASWSERQREDWMAMFSRPGLANIALHEVAPGHYSHGRAMRRAQGEVRRTLRSETFSEGWAHYVEELALEQGFRDSDPAFAVAVARDGLLRVTRMACAIGLNTGTMTTADAVARYESDVFLAGHAAHVAAQRVAMDPTTIGYTWGKLAILDVRERAKSLWGKDFSVQRLHRAMLALGSPPLGLLQDVLA
ncbi:DUF885 family protein [Allokutzneria sp. NRRL B-24872]|uniref:DUF885 family protein n=1 Tax=Allokutzneria sp. NRRL B-24872 TaxID=1137961 RepID=UPI000A3A28FE|nr:DUF885 family protein [Allokutzneria sp. NRRL B-24872]